MLAEARHFAHGRSVRVECEAGVVRSLCDGSNDSTMRWIAPAFFDPQINGAMGVWFNSPGLDADKIRQVVQVCLKHGIGGFCPTVITDSHDAIACAFRTLTRAVEQDRELARRIPVITWKVPTFPARMGPRGAHPWEHCRNPDRDEFLRWQDAAGGRIRMVTLAPERPGAIAFIEFLAESGVVAALGHTAATESQLADAVAAGARTSTHLGNGSHAMLPRHDNYIWHQLANDRLWASIIPDGHHLTASVVKTIIRTKGTERTLITCDASSLAGLPPGQYHEWGNVLEVQPGGRIVLSGTPYLAGSGVFTDQCVSRVLTMAGVTLADAVAMASIRPRELLGLPVPALAAGSPADFIEFDWQPGEEIHNIRGIW